MGGDRAPLGGSDIGQVEALVERLDAVDDLGTFGRVVATALLALVPGISASYNELNPIAGRAYAVIVPEPDEAWWSYYTPVFERLSHQHPYVRHLLAGGVGAAATWDDLPDGERFRSTELYRRFYAPLGIESQLLTQLPAPEGIVVGLAVNRGPEGFSERDRHLVDTLRGHLVRAYRRVQLTEERDRLGLLLGRDGWHVVLVDDDGVVVATTSEACRPGEALPAPLLDRFRATGTPPFWVDDAKPAMVRVTGVAAEPEVAVAATVVRNRVPPHVVHLRIGTRLPVDRLRGLGLSERQAVIAQLVADGATNVAIANELGISPATVKKHLESIYRVLGVHTRAAAVAALTTSA